MSALKEIFDIYNKQVLSLAEAIRTQSESIGDIRKLLITLDKRIDKLEKRVEELEGE